jgi:hypothetical protein
LEYSSLKCNEHSNTYADSAISNIEDGSEENVIVSTPERNPIRKESFPQGEVQHVDHLSLKESGITSSFGKKCGYLIKAFIKDEAVKGAVDHIAYCTGEDEREGNNGQSGRILALKDSDVPSDTNDGYDPEKAENQFSPLPAKFQAEGHSIVFGEVNDEPIGHAEFLTERHMGLDPKLNALVYQENDKNNYPGSSQRFISFASSPRYSM